MPYDEQHVEALISEAEKALKELREALRGGSQQQQQHHHPPPPGGTDAIDLTQADITSESPDVRRWPIGASMKSITLSATANMSIDFTKRFGPNAWPFVEGPEGGDLQYTIWIGCFIAGKWKFAGPILCISRGENDNYVPTGPTLAPGHLPENWYYYAGHPLATYQPQPGEKVAWFLTSGVQRRRDTHVIAERTNVVLTPFSEGSYRFD